MVQEQDSCLKSHLPPECERCISAVFHWAAFAGYWQKPPTNKLSVHKSQLFDFQNESSHLPFFVSFLLVTNVYRTHPCHFKLYFSLYYIWQCTFFLDASEAEISASQKLQFFLRPIFRGFFCRRICRPWYLQRDWLHFTMMLLSIRTAVTFYSLQSSRCSKIERHTFSDKCNRVLITEHIIIRIII